MNIPKLYIETQTCIDITDFNKYARKRYITNQQINIAVHYLQKVERKTK